MTSHFNPTDTLIKTFCGHLKDAYVATFGGSNPDIGEMILWAGSMALEIISSTDALYHNLEHTMHVTLVGQEILRGKQIKEGGVTPVIWMNVLISLLCHDIGYIKGVCKEDDIKENRYADGKGGFVTLPKGSTDAALTPHHVDRGKLFVMERFGGHPSINAKILQENIELTRFPVPNGDDHKDTTGYPGLVRAADLMGQMSDTGYIRKIPALFYEFKETGTHGKLAYETPDDLKNNYPKFFWSSAVNYLKPAISFLKVTQTGQQYLNNLFSNVFAIEHLNEL